jgi:hypothetical protein
VSDLEEVLKLLQQQLDWRGPSGKPQGHIVLSRQHTALLIEKLRAVMDRRDDDA